MASSVPEDDKEEEKLFSLYIYEELDRNQSSHGISHEDYNQYHEYCTKRLFRLRHNKAVRKELVHNSKYVEGVSLRRHHFCPRLSPLQQVEAAKEKRSAEAEEEKEEQEEIKLRVSHENILWELFISSERSWAQACALAQQQKKHQLVLKRLRKACKFASELQEVMDQAGANVRTKLECQSYTGWMKGNYALQKKNYKEALQQYSSSMNILLQLAKTSTTTEDDNTVARNLVLSDLWSTRAENVLRPLVRYCQYECKDHTTGVVHHDVETPEEEEGGEDENSIVVTYRGRRIPLDSYKNLCVLYLKIENLLELDEEDNDDNNHNDENVFYLDDKQFLLLLSTCDDAIVYANKELSHYSNIQNPGPAVNAKKFELNCLLGYWKNLKLQTCVKKQEFVLETQCHSDAEKIHVYDALLQNVQELTKLPNPNKVEANNASGDAENDNDIMDPELEQAYANVLRIRSYRCYYLAKYYCHRLNQTSDALALCQQTNTLLKRALEEMEACSEDGMEHAEQYLQGLEELKDDCAALLCQLQTMVYLEQYNNNRNNGGSNISSAGGFSPLSMSSTNRSLLLRLDDFDSGPKDGSNRVVNPDLNPETIPIPCKPAFYDIAWSYAVGQQIPLLMEELETEIQEREEEQRKKQQASSAGASGGVGLFSGWFG